MSIVFIKLKKIGDNRYALFGPDDNQISGIYRGPRRKAKDWAEAFCSSWYNWGVDYKEVDDEEETDRISEQNL